jgi:hypothetical protein
VIIDYAKREFAGKVYFVAWYYDVKLQADNHVRWDVAERLNRKQIKH